MVGVVDCGGCGRLWWVCSFRLSLLCVNGVLLTPVADSTREPQVASHLYQLYPQVSSSLFS